jgi:hypothetical protein
MGLDADVMERAIFERIQLSREDLVSAVITNGAKRKNVAVSGHVVEHRCIVYLAEVYRRLCRAQRSK